IWGLGLRHSRRTAGKLRESMAHIHCIFAIVGSVWSFGHKYQRSATLTCKEGNCMPYHTKVELITLPLRKQPQNIGGHMFARHKLSSGAVGKATFRKCGKSLNARDHKFHLFIE
uniref:Uncharacterized protein n=1 Tax=Parascaris univalens TaxID=6257 RepID=A0A915BJG4_PARUN